MRDQTINIDPAIHIHVDDAGHIRPPACAAKSGPAPDAPRHELERTCADLCASGGNPDNHTFAPALMCAFERRTHHVRIANTFERIIRAAAGQFNEMPDKAIMPIMILRVYKMRHAELACHCLAGRVQVHPDNLARADQFQPLNNVQPDPA